MNAEMSEALFLDEAGGVTITQLVECSGLSEAELRELVECGALAPVDVAAMSWTFSRRSVVTVRTARRLRHDFALDDIHSLAIVLRLSQRIEALEASLRALHALSGSAPTARENGPRAIRSR